MLIGFNKHILRDIIRRVRVSSYGESIVPDVLPVGFHKHPNVRSFQLRGMLHLHFLQSSSPPHQNRLRTVDESSRNYINLHRFIHIGAL